VLLTAVLDRYRLVVVPYFLIFGAAALVETWDAFRAGRMGRALGLVALGGLAGGLVNLPHFYAPEDTFSRPYYALARYHFEREDELQAERFARRSLEGAPAYGPSHLLLGRIRLSAGRNVEALGHFEAAVRWDPSFPGALYGAGLAAFRLGRWDEAETRFRRALEAEPDGAAPYWLGRVAAARGDAAGAAGWYRRAVTRPGIPPEAWLGLARALLVLGDRAGAEAAYRGVPEGVRDPELERLGLRRGPISPAVPEGGR
jgi:tetratricopeptide (TPR) repeat protein